MSILWWATRVRVQQGVANRILTRVLRYISYFATQTGVQVQPSNLDILHRAIPAFGLRPYTSTGETGRCLGELRQPREA